MRNSVLYLYYICVLLSGCGNQNNQKFRKNYIQLFNENENIGTNKTDMDDSDMIYYLDFELNLKSINEDKFTINSIAKNVSFIPLETSDTVLLYSDRIQIEKINERYLISSSSIFTAFPSIMIFDTTGHFIDYLIQKGQGPQELPYISEWSCNHATQILVASTFQEIVVHSFENNKKNKYILEGFFSDACLLNDGTVIGLPNVSGKGDTETPYLHFLNQEGKIVRSIYYPQKRKIEYGIPEGKIPGHSEIYCLYPSYSGDALFKDMFNDTIYRIRNMDDVKPYIVLYKGSLTPTIKDVNNPATGFQKVRLIQILDAKKYFFIRYAYRGEIFSSIWDKQTLTLIANTKLPSQLSRFGIFNIVTNYRTLTGKEILIKILNYFDSKLYCVLDAAQAMEFLPGIEEDDNPVLMIIDI